MRKHHHELKVWVGEDGPLAATRPAWRVWCGGRGVKEARVSGGCDNGGTSE